MTFGDTIAAIMKFFADDAKVYRRISTVENVPEVQNSVEQSETWSDILEMLFNLKNVNICILVLDNSQPHTQ